MNAQNIINTCYDGLTDEEYTKLTEEVTPLYLSVVGKAKHLNISLI